MEEVSITLPVSAWNVVMQALGQRPFVEVAELIAEVKRQGDAAVAAKGDDAATEAQPS